ncbi:MAG: hypothetical protein ACTTHG_06775 [Treponemataceae bacterium]
MNDRENLNGITFFELCSKINLFDSLTVTVQTAIFFTSGSCAVTIASPVG